MKNKGSHFFPVFIPIAAITVIYYFKETIKLKRGDIFVSQLDFNVENGSTEEPGSP